MKAKCSSGLTSVQWEVESDYRTGVISPAGFVRSNLDQL